MKRLLLLLLVSVISMNLSAQSSADTGFALQKKVIDSLMGSIDNNKMMTHILATGDLMYGAFKANCYYVVGTRKISKLECFFADSTAGKKVIYYLDNEPFRIIDKSVAYNYAGNELFYDDGRPVKKYISRDLVFFMQEVIKLMLNVLD